jgi:hypothetical protein
MSVWDGEQVFIDNCAACHGDFAEGLDNWPPLAGGRGSLTDERPVKTVGSYWPHLSTVWDYVHRSMPYGNAQVLGPDEVYGIVAYILYSEGLVDDDFVLSDENFGEIVLPNNENFYVDDREEAEFPLFSAAPCMSDCKDSVDITRRAADLNVTPRDDAGRIVSTIPSVLAGPPSLRKQWSRWPLRKSRSPRRRRRAPAPIRRWSRLARRRFRNARPAMMSATEPGTR